MDWYKWHEAYDSSPTLQARLRLARTHITQALEAVPYFKIQLVSVCAGDGRDVIGALINNPRRFQISASLVEINPALVGQGNAALEQYGLKSQVQFLEADATLAATYESIAPVDVLVVCGVFGNVRDSSLESMIRNLACLCRSKAMMVWTRSVGQTAVAKI
jgi:hypothetical protein